jgi:hypothetical protein|tara:strand:- start:902 stop:2578 length:1677 start_codon:yes stop_codon:yes gene_type:complete
MQINITNHVSEKLDELATVLENDNNLLITSPTDSGKTFAIVKYASLNRDKRIAFLMPTQALVDNVKIGYEGKEQNNIRCGYSKKWVQEYQDSNFICTTYDSYKFFEDDFDMVIVDEAHQLAGGGDYRNVPVSSILDIKSKLVLLTATPEVIELLPNFKKVEFVKTSKAKRTVSIIESDIKAKRTAISIIEKQKPNTLLILRIQDKQLIDHLHTLYSRDKNIVVLYSADVQQMEAHQDLDLYRQTKKGVIPKDVDILLCTSILDAGVSLEVSRNVEAWAISDYFMPNPIDMIQLYARVRTSSMYQMNLTIIGSFGVYEIDSSALPNGMNSSQLSMKMSQRYNEYSQIDFESYVGLLSYYNIQYQVINFKQGDVAKAKYAGKLKPVKIAKNLSNFKYEYDGIVHLCKNKGYENWLAIIEGKDIISSKSNRIVSSIYLDLQKAVDFNIYFGFFITEQYRKNVFIPLADACDSNTSSIIFRKVLSELLIGYNMHEGDKFTMILTNYNRLNTSQKKSIKTVSSLLYDGRKWNSSTIRLERLPKCIYVDMYLNNFIETKGTKVA